MAIRFGVQRHYCYLLTRALPEGGCRYYVGIRTAPKGKTPKADTSYLGSGDAIRRAVQKHGRAAFSKTILEVFDTRGEAAAMERALVGSPTASSKWSYNLRTGGEDSNAVADGKRRARERRVRDAERQAAREERAEAVRRVVDAERARRGLRGRLPRKQRENRNTE
ncbi:MAG: hypothetical protein GC161_15950 [Planctomycetaceae bacterium]|nr:hypothetical protein [Planctomycetaceae bacterium]